MTLTLTEIPKVDGSAWNAAHNHVIFKFARKDFNIISITDDSGFVKIVSAQSMPNPEHRVGDTVYFESSTVYATSGIITAIDNGANSITLNAAFISVTAGGFYNLSSRTGYVAVVQIIDQRTGQITPRTFPANIQGEVLADLSDILLNELILPDVINMLFVNYADPNRDIHFRISWRSGFIDANGNGVSSSLTIETDDIFGIKAAQQIGDQDNANMNKNMISQVTVGQFQTNFVEPSYWTGLPWSTGFIYESFSEDLSATQLERGVQPRDINKATVGPELLDNMSGGLGFFQRAGALTIELLEEPIPAGVDFIDLWIQDSETGLVTGAYVDGDYVDPDYVA